MAVIVNYQISGKPHQPVCQIAVFGIVLVERFVNADKNILRQIFGGFDARRKAIGEIKDAPRKGRNNLLPSRSVAGTTTPDKVCAIADCRYF
jgi:hypothetical protein